MWIVKARFDLGEIVRLGDIVHSHRSALRDRREIGHRIKKVSLAGAWIADEDKDLPLSLGESLEEVFDFSDELLTFDLPVIVRVILFGCLDWQFHRPDGGEALVRFPARTETSASLVSFEVEAVLGANTVALTVREKVDRSDLFSPDHLLDQARIGNHSVNSWTRRPIVRSVFRESFEGFECSL
jgi:hypothetical protein